jgi:multidrug efflux system membrane fusion protein
MALWLYIHTAIQPSNYEKPTIMKKVNLFLIVIFSFTVVVSCKKSPPKVEEKSAIPVRTEIVKEQLLSFPVRTSGRLTAKTESKLSFKTGGIIKKIYVDEGQSVKEGELLSELNLSEIEPRAKQAELALQKAERDYQRAKNLYRDSVATLEQFQDAKTALEYAKSNAEIAKFNLKYSDIRAPGNGKILKRVSESNEIVGPGQPIFLFASTESSWVVRSNVTDKDIVHISLNDSATIEFDAYPGKTFYGRITETGNMADPYTGTYEVEITMKEQPESLVSGFIVTVTIYPAKTSRNMILIPAEAVQEGNGISGNVWLMKDEKPVRQVIEIHSITDRGIIVASGLVEGDEIITEGGEYVREGVDVEKKNY